MKAYPDIGASIFKSFDFLPWIVAAMAALCFFHRLGEGSLPPFDDTTYALISKTILQTGNWLTMYWQGTPYLLFGKPPWNLWITALFYKGFGVSEFTSRMSSAIHGAGGIAVTYLLGRELHSRAAGLIASFFLLSFPDYFQLSQSAMLDIPLTFYIALSLFSYLAAERTGRWTAYVLFGISFGLAILTKQTVGVLPLIVIFVFHLCMRDVRNLIRRPMWAGVTCGLAVALPWHVLQACVYGQAVLDKYIIGSLVHNITEVLVSGQRTTALFYFKHLFDADRVHFFLFLISVVLLLQPAWRQQRHAVFALTYALSCLIIFSLFQTRMLWYLAPAFPGIALCAAMPLADAWARSRREKVAVLLLAVLLSYQTVVLLTRDHWYLQGDPELKQIMLELRSKSRPEDVLYAYGFGEPLNAAPFYADRKAMYVTRWKEDFEFQQRLGDYIRAGRVMYVPEEQAVDWIRSMNNQFVVLRSSDYGRMKTNLDSISVIAQNESYVILRP